ncbi:MAG: HEAT repeat domain-containing protein [Ignavibacteriales bacterium]|nr:HEAT repeat domain-containing protein [Ignavibacteriales bacterium]
MPKERTRSLESVIYAVASIGNDQAVDFLGKVAKTSENYDIRRRAVYYLGNIGGDKARAVLLEILKAK